MLVQPLYKVCRCYFCTL